MLPLAITLLLVNRFWLHREPSESSDVQITGSRLDRCLFLYFRIAAVCLLFEIGNISADYFRPFRGPVMLAIIIIMVYLGEMDEEPSV